MILSLIVAVSKNGIIGKLGKIPWHIPADLKRFKKITMGHHIIMGRKTFESIGKPLPGRHTIILSKQKDYQQEDCHSSNTVEKAIAHCIQEEETEAFIIGGENIFKEALANHSIDRVYLTQIHQNYEGDTFFTVLDQKRFKLAGKENYKEYSFLNYTRISPQEKEKSEKKVKEENGESLSIGKLVYFIYEEELYIGKIAKETQTEKFEVLTYTTQEARLELNRNVLYSSLKEGDQHFRAIYPKADTDFDKLMDIARFLQS